MHTNIIATIAVPSVIIAAHKNGNGAFRYIVTIVAPTSTKSYPCRSMEASLNLSERVLNAFTTPRKELAAAN
jgi:hypothetical protein